MFTWVSTTSLSGIASVQSILRLSLFFFFLIDLLFFFFYLGFTTAAWFHFAHTVAGIY